MQCPVCLATSFVLGKGIYDDRYGEPNQYNLAACSVCGHLSTVPRMLESDLPSLYGTFYPRKNLKSSEVLRNARKSKLACSKLLRWIQGTNNQGQYSANTGDDVLDVGCGDAVSLVELKDRGASPFGIETDHNVKQIAEDLNLMIHFGTLMDSPFPNQKFDLIVMNQVIEHLPDPASSLSILLGRLKPNGRIIVSFPNINSIWRRLSGVRWINWHVPYHQHHFSLYAFRRMAQSCGFKVFCSRTITPNLWTLLQMRALLRHPMRSQPDPFWQISDKLNESKKIIKPWAPFRVIMRVALLTVITPFNRIIDSFGVGDSLVVELHKADA